MRNQWGTVSICASFQVGLEQHPDDPIREGGIR
jgi:hypothetical protein